MGPYVQKNKATKSIDIIVEATKHICKYISVTKDKDTNKLFVQFEYDDIYSQPSQLIATISTHCKRYQMLTLQDHV